MRESIWTVPTSGDTSLCWEYAAGRDDLISLYRKGKQRQWNADDRIDWSHALDPENPAQLDDEFNIGIYGSDIWNSMSPSERVQLRVHTEACRMSQFLHGEQAALVCAAKIVQTAPDLDAKFFAATQVVDEARHVEVFARYLNEKVGVIYPINQPFKTLVEQTVGDRRWDLVYLGMQILIEGLALAAFSAIRDTAQSPLAASIAAYVVEDEARHISFGRAALRDYYPKLTQAERDEREEFVVEACRLMGMRITTFDEVYRALGLPVEASAAHASRSRPMLYYRRRLFQRIVPTIKAIGLWGERVQRLFAELGVLDLGARDDAERMLSDDEEAAREFDARRAEVATAIVQGT